MKTITIITPSNIEVEYRLAGAGSRLGAFLIDYLVQILINLAGAIIILWLFDRITFGNYRYPSTTALAVYMVFTFVLLFGYFIFCEMTMRGQSVGKRVFGLRVIRDNGLPIEFWQSLIRGLLRNTVDMIYIGLFVILFSKKHKRIGDFAAGTIVISEHYEEETALFNIAEWHNSLPDPFLLTPEERQLAEDWLSRRNLLPDGGAEIGEKLIRFLKEKYETENTL